MSFSSLGFQFQYFFWVYFSTPFIFPNQQISVSLTKESQPDQQIIHSSPSTSCLLTSNFSQFDKNIKKIIFSSSLISYLRHRLRANPKVTAAVPMTNLPAVKMTMMTSHHAVINRTDLERISRYPPIQYHSRITLAWGPVNCLDMQIYLEKSNIQKLYFSSVFFPQSFPKYLFLVLNIRYKKTDSPS